MLGKKKSKVKDERKPRPRPERFRYPVTVLLRMFLLGSVAVVAAVWALWRSYTVPHAPMLVPVTPAPAASEIDVEP